MLLLVPVILSTIQFLHKLTTNQVGLADTLATSVPAGRTATMTAATSSGANSRWTQIAPIITVFVYAGLLLTYHVEAGRNNSEWDDSSGAPYSDAQVVDSLVDRILMGPDGLTTLDKIFFGVLIMLAFELLNFLTKNSGRWFNQSLIPVRGKHLDELEHKDLAFIGINKAGTAPFVYILLRYAYFENNMVWDVQKASIKNVLLPLPVIFIVYDFFYGGLHWLLHIKRIYGYIHKHHHHQKAPSRANVDAVNVHPIEFFLGEYNYLWAVFLCCHVLGMQVHILCTLLFLAIGGLLAGVNHTRFDVVWKIRGIQIYDSKAHDVHHRIPQSNYGQYTMFWDYLFGSYRPYNPEDRINPKKQLDPKTGKSLEYMQLQKLTSKIE